MITTTETGGRPSYAAQLRLLLSRKQMAEACGISTRATYAWIKAGVLPPPLLLGERSTRWDAAEVAEYLSRAPRQAPKSEPASLLRSRIERAKKTGDLR